MTQREISFMEAANYLLAHTYIPKDKEEDLYYFCRDSIDELSKHFRKMGYFVEHNEAGRFVSLKKTTEALSEARRRDENIYMFKKFEQGLIGILIQYYNANSLKQEIFIGMDELREIIGQEYKSTRTQAALNDALKTLKDYNFVDFSNLDRQNCPIQIYPTILEFAEVEVLKNIIESYEQEDNIEE